LSDRQIDLLVAGNPAAQPQQAHLETCVRCRDRQALFAESADLAAPAVARLAARVSQRAAQPAPTRSRWRFSPLAGGLLAAGAAVMLLAVPGDLPEGPSMVRAKGSGMRLVVQREGRVFSARSGELFYPGDALRFVITAGGPGHFMLVGIDGTSGEVSAFHPFGGERSVALEEGGEQALPGSLVLDDSPASDIFIGLFAEQPFSLTEVRDAIAAAGGAGAGAFDAPQPLDLPGAQHWFVVRKGQPARQQP